MIKKSDQHFQQCKTLANAVIVQAAKDYRAAVKRLVKKPDHTKSLATIEEIEEFFLSDYFSTLSDLDGAQLLKSLRKEAYQIISKEGRNDNKRSQRVS